MSSQSNTIHVTPHLPKPTHISHTVTTNAPSAPTSVHDTLRHGPQNKSFSVTTGPTTKHPLEDRLRLWDENEERRKMEMIKRVFGLGEVVRRGMEMNFAGADYRPACLGGSSNLHLDILRNKDCSIQWEDVFTDDVVRDAPSFHDELERKLRMNW